MYSISMMSENASIMVRIHPLICCTYWQDVLKGQLDTEKTETLTNLPINEDMAQIPKP